MKLCHTRIDMPCYPAWCYDYQLYVIQCSDGHAKVWLSCCVVLCCRVVEEWRHSSDPATMTRNVPRTVGAGHLTQDSLQKKENVKGEGMMHDHAIRGQERKGGREGMSGQCCLFYRWRVCIPVSDHTEARNAPSHSTLCSVLSIIWLCNHWNTGMEG